jgi:type II secretory pathway pseudopilin PulG
MSKPNAFTLLELLITSSVTALLMLAISSLFVTFLATAYKSQISQNLRESGTNAMNQMIELIRSSTEITSACNPTTPLNYLSLTNADGLDTTLQEEDDRIASISAIAESKLYLTESNNHPNYLSSLSFTCYPTTEGKKYIEIAFTLQVGDNMDASNSARSTSLDFSSGLVTRN